MAPDVASLAQVARRLRSFLERNKAEEQVWLPGFRQFPKDCCEGASCLLASVFEELGLEEVAVIEGYDKAANDHHFWVESGGRIYDLTADQFAGAEPVFGGEHSPAIDRFADRAAVPERRYFDRAEVRGLMTGGLLDP